MNLRPYLAIASVILVTVMLRIASAEDEVDLYSTGWLCGQDHVTPECFKYVEGLMQKDFSRAELVKRALELSGASDLSQIVSPCAPSAKLEGMFEIAGQTDFASGTDGFTFSSAELLDSEKRAQLIAARIATIKAKSDFPKGAQVSVSEHLDYVMFAYTKATSICLIATDKIQEAADTLTHELTHYDYAMPAYVDASGVRDILTFANSDEYVRYVFSRPGGEADAFTRQFSALIRRDGKWEENSIPFPYLKDEFASDGRFIGKLDDANITGSLLDSYTERFAAVYSWELLYRKWLVDSALSRRNLEAPSDARSQSLIRLNAEEAELSKKKGQ